MPFPNSIFSIQKFIGINKGFYLYFHFGRILLNILIGIDGTPIYSSIPKVENPFNATPPKKRALPILGRAPESLYNISV